MSAKRRSLLMILVIAILFAIFSGTRPSHAADNTWYVVTDVTDVKCIIFNGSLWVHWFYTEDYSVQPGDVTHIQGFLNGNLAHDQTLFSNSAASAINTSIPFDSTVSSIPLVYKQVWTTYTPAGLPASTVTITLTCRKIGAAGVTLTYNKNIN